MKTIAHHTEILAKEQTNCTCFHALNESSVTNIRLLSQTPPGGRPSRFFIRVSFASASATNGNDAITLMLDVFNATNSDNLVNFRLRSGSRYNEVIALLDPRVLRFSARYEL